MYHYSKNYDDMLKSAGNAGSLSASSFEPAENNAVFMNAARKNPGFTELLNHPFYQETMNNLSEVMGLPIGRYVQLTIDRARKNNPDNSDWEVAKLEKKNFDNIAMKFAKSELEDEPQHLFNSLQKAGDRMGNAMERLLDYEDRSDEDENVFYDGPSSDNTPQNYFHQPQEPVNFPTTIGEGTISDFVGFNSPPQYNRNQTNQSGDYQSNFNGPPFGNLFDRMKPEQAEYYNRYFPSTSNNTFLLQSNAGLQGKNPLPQSYLLNKIQGKSIPGNGVETTGSGVAEISNSKSLTGLNHNNSVIPSQQNSKKLNNHSNETYRKVRDSAKQAVSGLLMNFGIDSKKQHSIGKEIEKYRIILQPYKYPSYNWYRTSSDVTETTLDSGIKVKRQINYSLSSKDIDSKIDFGDTQASKFNAKVFNNSIPSSDYNCYGIALRPIVGGPYWIKTNSAKEILASEFEIVGKMDYKTYINDPSKRKELNRLAREGYLIGYIGENNLKHLGTIINIKGNELIVHGKMSKLSEYTHKSHKYFLAVNTLEKIVIYKPKKLSPMIFIKNVFDHPVKKR